MADGFADDSGGHTGPAGTPRVVLDTNAWLDLLRFDDPRIARLGAAIRSGEVVAVTDDFCRDEWLRVLDYPQLHLDPAERARLLEAFDALARCLPATPHDPAVTLPRCRDGDDQKFVALAHASGSRWLVSRDRAVLALDRRAQRVGGFRIVTPEAWVPTAQADASPICVGAR